MIIYQGFTIEFYEKTTLRQKISKNYYWQCNILKKWLAFLQKLPGQIVISLIKNIWHGNNYINTFRLIDYYSFYRANKKIKYIC